MTLLTFRTPPLIPTPVPKDAPWNITWACWFNSLLKWGCRTQPKAVRGIWPSHLTVWIMSALLMWCLPKGSYCFPVILLHTPPPNTPYVLWAPVHDSSDASAMRLLPCLSPVLKYRLLGGKKWILFHFGRWNSTAGTVAGQKPNLYPHRVSGWAWELNSHKTHWQEKSRFV